MAKFRISMELQGLKLEIEGMSEDAPMIAQNLTQQFGGLLRPAAHLVEGEVMEDGDGQPTVGAIPSGNGGTPRRRTTRRPRAASTANGGYELTGEVRYVARPALGCQWPFRRVVLH